MNDLSRKVLFNYRGKLMNRNIDTLMKELDSGFYEIGPNSNVTGLPESYNISMNNKYYDFYEDTMFSIFEKLDFTKYSVNPATNRIHGELSSQDNTLGILEVVSDGKLTVQYFHRLPDMSVWERSYTIYTGWNKWASSVASVLKSDLINDRIREDRLRINNITPKSYIEDTPLPNDVVYFLSDYNKEKSITGVNELQASDTLNNDTRILQYQSVQDKINAYHPYNMYTKFNKTINPFDFHSYIDSKVIYTLDAWKFTKESQNGINVNGYYIDLPRLMSSEELGEKLEEGNIKAILRNGPVIKRDEFYIFDNIYAKNIQLGGSIKNLGEAPNQIYTNYHNNIEGNTFENIPLEYQWDVGFSNSAEFINSMMRSDRMRSKMDFVFDGAPTFIDSGTLMMVRTNNYLYYHKLFGVEPNSDKNKKQIYQVDSKTNPWNVESFVSGGNEGSTILGQIKTQNESFPVYPVVVGGESNRKYLKAKYKTIQNTYPNQTDYQYYRIDNDIAKFRDEVAFNAGYPHSISDRDYTFFNLDSMEYMYDVLENRKSFEEIDTKHLNTTLISNYILRVAYYNSGHHHFMEEAISLLYDSSAYPNGMINHYEDGRGIIVEEIPIPFHLTKIHTSKEKALKLSLNHLPLYMDNGKVVENYLNVWFTRKQLIVPTISVFVECGNPYDDTLYALEVGYEC